MAAGFADLISITGVWLGGKRASTPTPPTPTPVPETVGVVQIIGGGSGRARGLVAKARKARAARMLDLAVLELLANDPW